MTSNLVGGGWIGLDWIGLDCVGLGWTAIELGWAGLDCDWIGLGRIGLGLSSKPSLASVAFFSGTRPSAMFTRPWALFITEAR